MLPSLRAYSYEQVAEVLNVSVKTVCRMVDARELKSFKLRGAGRYMRISKTALQDSGQRLAVEHASCRAIPRKRPAS